MYLLWWDKPFDVEHSVHLVCLHSNRDQVISRLRATFETRYASKFLTPSWDDYLREQRIRNWAYMDDLGLGEESVILHFHQANLGRPQDLGGWYTLNHGYGYGVLGLAPCSLELDISIDNRT